MDNMETHTAKVVNSERKNRKSPQKGKEEEKNYAAAFP